jgi:alkanesulfonate monooxygenase SsuD/methylene tetrahydromethanopterin reductase-like flavin-dependent oxidoreductase (luciferase family)
VNLRIGNPGQLPPPVAGFKERLGPGERTMLDQVLSCSAVGNPADVREAVQQFITRTGANELLLGGMIFDHSARLRSFALAAEALAA